jgi:histidine triad (HIT) family protein
MNETNCLFCEIISEKIPSKRIYEDEICIGILDIFPVSKGHSLIIPRMHYTTIEDIPDNILKHLVLVVKKLGELIHKKLEIDGYNILQNNFAAAGQVINHFHIHIIPRSKNDSKFRLKIPKIQVDDSILENIKSKILE